MNPLDAATTSDHRISMEGLKAFLAANAVACAANTARIALLCAAPSTTTTTTSTPELRTAQTVDSTTAPDTRDDGNHSDLNGTVATLPVPATSLLLHSASEISLPLHAALEFQPFTPTRCSTQCTTGDAGMVTPAFDRGTSPSTTLDSSWRPLQLEGDQDNRCIEANGVSALDSPSSSSHTATPINAILDHDIGRNLAAATPPCMRSTSATSRGAPPTPARRPAIVLELDKLMLDFGIVDVIDIIKLDAAASHWMVLVSVFRTLTINSNASTEELRPPPWPLFVHSQGEGPLRLPSMNELMWLTKGADTSYETRCDPGGCCFSARIRQWWLLLIITKGSLVKIHLQEPWPPLQGMYKMPYLDELHHRFCCYAINFDLQGMSPSAGIYSPAIDEPYCFSCELFAIETPEKFWPYGQISYTMDFLITQCKQYVPLWQSLSFISGCWLNTRVKVMAMELWATARQLCLSCNSCGSCLRSKHGPACAFIDSCLAAATENCWCYPFWAKSWTNLAANLKCYLETLASLVPCSGSLGLGAQVQQEPNDDGVSSWSSFFNDHFNCSDGKNQKCLLQANKAIYICHSLATALVCWQLPWPLYMQSGGVLLIVKGVCTPWDPGVQTIYCCCCSLLERDVFPESYRLAETNDQSTIDIIKIWYAYELLTNPVLKRDYDLFGLDHHMDIFERVKEQYQKETLGPQFIGKSSHHKFKAIFFSSTGERAAPFLLQAAHEYSSYASFAFVLWKEEESQICWNSLGVESAPALVFLKGPGAKPVVYHGTFSKSEFKEIMEEHKHQELQQLRSDTSLDLGWDARGHSRAGKETMIWYCVIAAGCPGVELSKNRQILTKAQDQLLSAADESTTRNLENLVEVASAATALKDEKYRRKFVPSTLPLITLEPVVLEALKMTMISLKYSLSISKEMQQRAAATELIKHHLLRAQQCMKHQENKHHSERTQSGGLGLLEHAAVYTAIIGTARKPQTVIQVLWPVYYFGTHRRRRLPSAATCWQLNTSSDSCLHVKASSSSRSDQHH